jgi:pimeloyl-ACP methyl ester carboxylesterase
MAGRGVDEVRAVSESPRPIAVVQGRTDPFIRDGYLEGLRYGNVWKGSPVFVDAGHAAHWQAAESFNAGMVEFLNDVA